MRSLVSDPGKMERFVLVTMKKQKVSIFKPCDMMFSYIQDCLNRHVSEILRIIAINASNTGIYLLLLTPFY